MEKKEIMSSPSRLHSITGGSQGRNHGRKGSLAFQLLPYTTQAHLPRNGSVHSGLGPPTSISNQENVSQTCPQANRTGWFFNWDFSPPRSAKVITKISHYPAHGNMGKRTVLSLHPNVWNSARPMKHMFISWINWKWLRQIRGLVYKHRYLSFLHMVIYKYKIGILTAFGNSWTRT